jgi:hypothetical protein
MDEACGSLEIEIKRIVNDLSFVAHKVEGEYRAKKCPNPLALGTRLEYLQTRLNEVKIRAATVDDEKQRVMAALSNAVAMLPPGAVRSGSGDENIRLAVEEVESLKTLLTQGILAAHQ